MGNSGKKDGKSMLREKAERIHKQKSESLGQYRSEHEILKLIQELEIHQIELELQNEELSEAKSATLEAFNNYKQLYDYTQLYDFAPSGYFSLTPEGKIIELNLTGAKMLGKERLLLKNSQFGFFLSSDSKPIFNLFLKKTFKSLIKESCEITLSVNKNKSQYIYLTGIVNGIKDQCFITATDITERVLAEKALKESEELHRITLENINDPVVITKDDGTFTFICPNIEENLGYTANEIAEMGNIYELLGENLFDLNELNSRDIIDNIEHSFTDNSGKKHVFLVSVKRVSIQGGTLLYVFHDITERKIAQDKMIAEKARAEENEAKFKAYTQNSPIAIYTTDVKGNCVYANNKWLEIAGLKLEEALGDGWIHALHPDDKKIVKQNWYKSVETDGNWHYEFRFVNKRGKVTWVDASAKELLSDKGEIIGYLGSNIDITDKKLTEESLIRSVQRFHDLVKLLPEAVFEMDTNFTLTYVNQQAMDLFGYSPNDLATGLNALEMIIPENRELAKNNFAKRLKGEEPGTIQYHGLKKDGTTFPILFHASSIIENGKLLGARGVIVDIAELKHAEQELVKSEEKFKTIFNISVVGKSITHLDGSLNVNKAFSQLVGYSEEELNQMKWQEFTHPEDIEKNEEIVKSIVAGTIKTARWEKRYIHKKGNIVWVDISTILQRDKEGQPQFFITSVVDITEKKNTENVLKKYKEIVSSTNDAIALLDKNYRYIIVNDAYKSFSKIKSDKLIGKTVEEYFGSDIFQNVIKANFDKCLAGEIVNYQHWYNHPKNGKRFIEVNYFPFREKENEITGVVAVRRDITESFEANQALKSEQTRLRTLVDNLPDAIYVADSLGRKVIANPADVKNIGASSQSEVLGKTDLELFPGEVGIRCYNESMDVIQSGNALINKEEYFVKDGVKNWMLTTKIPLFDEQQKIIGLVGIGRDITERKNAEQAILHAKEKAEAMETQLLSILENSPTGFAINKISTGKVTYLNKAFSNAYHIPIELCQDVESFFDYVYGDRMELGNKILEDLTSGVPERMKWNMIPVKDKTTKRTHYVSAANIVLKDLDLMISSVWDVTTQVKNEEKLVAALNRATESDRLKSAFLANMSHEIRTPMNGILGFSELLKTPKLSGEDQHKYIEIIEKSGARMLNTINNIIDISKIESGQMQVLISKVDIREQVENIISFFEPEADKKHTKLSINNKLNQQDICFYSDKEKIYAILTNLVKNALKYCDSGIIEIGMDKIENEYEFYVKDTGKGIPEDRQQAIFERFIQADIHDREALQGSGLGLAISKSYIEMLGGKIWLKSKEGQGTTFYCTIPESQVLSDNEKIKVPDSKTAPLIQAKKLKILIAEDDQVSAMLVELMVKKYSSEILTAKTGKQAVAICKANPDIDLILMDIRMPKLDGYEATKVIRTFNTNVIIIAQTAFALSGDNEKAIMAGCNDYVSKPVDIIKLKEIINKYFR